MTIANTKEPFSILNNYEFEVGTLQIDGTGTLTILNTGGSSASEGGMGSGQDEDKTKGDLSKSAAPEKEDNGPDPIGKNIAEKEQEAKKEQ